MPSVGLRAPLIAYCALLLSACSGLMPHAAPAAPTPVSDPTPLSKCHVAASATSPLVTEWPASEKAHLQSLAAYQTVAVEYSGCELHIVDGCQLPGNYGWSRTTLATDTLEIEDADELYAKLPIGAIGLEGELERSGRLAVRTTVAGQLRARGMTSAHPDDPACASATHFISAISIGSFQLLSGSDTAASGRVDVGVSGGGAKARRKEAVLREAGSRAACDESSDEAPSSQCASPIQVFLSPLSPKASAAAPPAQTPQQAAVYVSFPPPSDGDELWTLRAPGGKVLCALPCGQWVGPVSGYYLQREPRNGASMHTLSLPQAFPHPVGSRVTAEYQAKWASPELARWAFYGSIPMAVMGLGLFTAGVVQAASDCEPDGCRVPTGFFIGGGLFFMVPAAGGIGWYMYSREDKLITYEDLSSRGQHSGIDLKLGPSGVYGTF